MTITIISLTVTALVSALGSVANAGNAQRSATQVDVVIRNYAEATKLAVRRCNSGGRYSVDYTPPASYAVQVSPRRGTCPTVLTTSVLTLTVTGPNSVERTMQIRVRTP